MLDHRLEEKQLQLVDDINILSGEIVDREAAGDDMTQMRKVMTDYLQRLMPGLQKQVVNSQPGCGGSRNLDSAWSDIDAQHEQQLKVVLLGHGSVGSGLRILGSIPHEGDIEIEYGGQLDFDCRYRMVGVGARFLVDDTKIVTGVEINGLGQCRIIEGTSDQGRGGDLLRVSGLHADVSGSPVAQRP